MTIRERLTRHRKRRQVLEGRIATLDAKIRTRLARVAQRPALAAYLAREFGLTFTSGWRSVAHNKAVGGVPNSWHTRGTLAKPGASDLVGREVKMQEALEWVEEHVPNLAEAMIHSVTSGRHLHVGGLGVINWELPKRGLLRKWRRKRAWARREAAAERKKIEELKRQIAAGAGERERKIRIARDHGAHYAGLIYDACQEEGIPFALGLAVCQQETGFENEYGHDRLPGQAPIWHGQTGKVLVTATNIVPYLAFARRTGLRQGVGPMQLTSGGYQEEAVRRGGLHKPEVTVPYGIEILAGHIKALGTAKGVGAFNGGRGRPNMGYWDDVDALWDAWRPRLAA